MTHAVLLRDVSFTYRDSCGPALDGVNFHVGHGEFVVIMGPTGAGKTTLARCLNRSIPGFYGGKLQGEVAIDGRSTDGLGVADLAGVVGFVSQDFETQLFATNVAQEVVFGMEQLGVSQAEMRDRLRNALQTVGLEGFDRRDPASLSGGEKQRLAIAAVLAMRPRILVFDEPTTDLDPEGKIQVFEVLASLRRRGFTIILVEHETEAAERADRLVLMKQGRIVADDQPQQLLREVELLQRTAVRALDIDRLARALGRESRFASIDEVVDALRPRLRARPLVRAAEAAGEVLLEAISVGQDYGSERWALRGVSLRLHAGDFVALVGQNGSGKSTLARHLNGLLQPREGRVLLRGQDIAKLPLAEVAREVGYVFQDPDQQIFAATVFEEVAFGLRNFGVRGAELERRVVGALDLVGLSGYAEADPFLLGKGQRQRLAVASVMALHPKVLILDEPTTGLDYAEQRNMMGLLQRLHAEGLTLVVITHSPWVVAEYAQRGVLMRAGRVVFDGPLRDLFAQEHLLASSHFRLPDVTRIGLRCGIPALRLEELLPCDER